MENTWAAFHKVVSISEDGDARSGHETEKAGLNNTQRLLGNDCQGFILYPLNQDDLFIHGTITVLESPASCLLGGDLFWV